MLILGSEADGCHIPGAILVKGMGIGPGGQADTLHRSPGDRSHLLALLDGNKTPGGRLTAPVGDVLAVKLHAVLEFQSFGGHHHGQFTQIFGRQAGHAVLGYRIEAVLDGLAGLAVEFFVLFKQTTDGIVDGNGRMEEAGVGFAGGEAGDELVVFIQIQPVGIGESIGGTYESGGMLANIHGAADSQNRGFTALGSIDRSSQLGIAEHIHHAVIADPVTGAEVLMGIVVKHTPAGAAGNVILGIDTVQDLGMAQSVLQALFLPVKGFGGEHMTVVFCDHVALVHIGHNILFRLAACIGAVVEEIVVGVDILQEGAFLGVADTAGGTAGIQLMGHGVGGGIKSIIVGAFIDPHAPDENTGVVAVLDHHVPDIGDGNVLPGLAADMLPAGDLGKDQQTQFIAAVQEGVALGIVGGSHHIDAQFVFQNVCIQGLSTGRSSIADVSPALMSVQTHELTLDTVDIQTIGAEIDGTETETSLVGIHQNAVPAKLNNKFT